MGIEIKGFLETSFVDWPGKICSVLFLPYCNFRCPYCHNHPLVLEPDRYRSIPLKQVLSRLRFFRGWIDGVCITGGEPTLHRDLPSLLEAIRSAGFEVKLDTNGSNPEMLEKLIRDKQVDFVSMDVKAPLDLVSYRRSTGSLPDLNAVRRSIEILKQGQVPYLFRMTVVPGLHREEDIERLARQLDVGPRFILQDFNPENPLDPSFCEIQPFDPRKLKEMERELQRRIEWGSSGL